MQNNQFQNRVYMSLQFHHDGAISSSYCFAKSQNSDWMVKNLLLYSFKSTQAVNGLILRCLEVKQTLFLVYCKQGSFANS